MTVEVTQTPQGVFVSANGSPPRPLGLVEGLTFRQGSAWLTFRRANGISGPVSELRMQSGSSFHVLKRQ